MGLPAMSSKCFGFSLVKGHMRFAKPPARTIAFMKSHFYDEMVKLEYNFIGMMDEEIDDIG
jgi:hypothetical protein